MEIQNITGYPISEINQIIYSLGDVIKDKIGNGESNVEIKVFPGLKILSRYLLPSESKSNLPNDNIDYVLNITSNFTDDFRKKIRNIHNSKIYQ